MKSPGALLTALLALLALPLSAARAETQTWTGLGEDGNWATAGNFSPGGVITSSDALVFDGTNYLTTNNNNLGIDSGASLTFAAGAGAFVLDGNGYGTTSGVANLSANLQTISLAQWTVLATQTWDAGAGGLRITSPVVFADSSTELTVMGSGDTRIEGDIDESITPSASSRLVKTGPGTLTLSGTDTYKGGTQLTAGTLLAGSSYALGTGPLSLGGGTTFGVEAGASIALSNDVSLLGDVSFLVANGDFLELDGTADLGAATRTLTFTDDGSFVCFMGIIAGSAGLNLQTLSGNSVIVTMCGEDDNTYSGLTTVGDGVTLSLQKEPGTLAIIGDVQIDVGGTVAFFDTSDQIGTASTVTIDGTLGFEAISDPITQTIGDLQGSGTVANIAGQTTLTVSAGDFAGTLTDDAADPLALVKSGPGTLILSGASLYTGGTAIDGGALLVDGSISGAVSVGSAGLLGGAGTVNGVVTLGGTLSADDGQLTLGSLEWSSGGQFAETLGGAATPPVVTGALAKNGAGPFSIALVDGGAIPGQTYTLMTFGSNAGFTESDFTVTGIDGAITLTAGALEFTVPALPPVYGVSMSVARKRNRATFMITNTGETTVNFLLRQTKKVRSGHPKSAGSSFKIVTKYGGRNLSKAIASKAGATITLGAGQSARLLVQIKTHGNPAYKRTIQVTTNATNLADPSKTARARTTLQLKAGR